MPSLLGTWRGGPNNNLVKIEVKPDGTCVASWNSSGPESGNMIGKLLNPSKFTGYWINPPNMDARNNLFEMVLSSDGNSWECTYKTRGGGGGTWTGTRVGSRRKAGEKLDTTGWCKDRGVFDRLVKPKDPASFDDQREAVLKESIARTKAPGEEMWEEPASLAVGDPYDDASKRRHSESSRYRGRQLVSGSTASLAQRLRDSRTEYVAAVYEDKSTLSRRLRREARARSMKLAVKDAKNRPPFGPAAKNPQKYRDPDVYLSSMPSDMVGKNLFAAAHTAREVAYKPKRIPKDAAVGAKTDERPPYCSAAAPGRGPLRRQPFIGLAATEPLPEAPTEPSPGKDLKKDERPVWKVHVGTSPLEREPFVGLLPTEEQLQEAVKEFRYSGDGRRPLSAPLRPRDKLPQAPKEGERPAFCPRVAPHQDSLAAYEYMPEPDSTERHIVKPSADDAKDKKPVFRPPSARHTRLTKSVAMSRTNLLRREASGLVGMARISLAK
jgi:hypothetical protein